MVLAMESDRIGQAFPENFALTIIELVLFRGTNWRFFLEYDSIGY